MEKNGRSEAASARQRNTSKLRSPPAATATARVGSSSLGMAESGLAFGWWPWWGRGKTEKVVLQSDGKVGGKQSLWAIILNRFKFGPFSFLHLYTKYTLHIHNFFSKNNGIC